MIELRPFWKKLSGHPALLVSSIAIILAIPRFYWLLNGWYNLVIVVFLVMWMLPLFFLTRNGRRNIGIRKPEKPIWLLYGFFIGILAAFVVYLAGVLLYQKSLDNWYVTVMNSFNDNNIIADVRPHFGIFLLISLPTMIFSPIGEEFFFRGMLQDSFAQMLGNRMATLIDAAFFGLTHLAHHGLAIRDSSLVVYDSAIIWVVLTMGISILLSFIRTQSGSIWGAVVCHSGFNLGMMGCIVYLLHE